MEKKNGIVKYFRRMICAHTIACFLAGIFALVVMNYKELFATETFSLLMLPVSDPRVALGAGLQIFRGIIIGLVLLPVRNVFFEEKYGFLKLGLLVLGLSLLSTIGPTMGSFDGYLYTKVPVSYHILGYPEAIVYILLFTGILKISYTYERRIIDILSVIFVVLICIMCIMGYLLPAPSWVASLSNHIMVALGIIV